MNDPTSRPTFRELLQKHAGVREAKTIAHVIDAIVLDPERSVFLVHGHGALNVKYVGAPLRPGSTVTLIGLRSVNKNTCEVDRVEDAETPMQFTPVQYHAQNKKALWFIFNEKTTCLDTAKHLTPGIYEDDRGISAKGVFQTRNGSPMAFFKWTRCEWSDASWSDMRTLVFETALFSESLLEFGITDQSAMAALLPDMLSSDSPTFILVGSESNKNGRETRNLRLFLLDREAWIRKHRLIGKVEAARILAANPCIVPTTHPWHTPTSTTFNVSESHDAAALIESDVELYSVNDQIVFGIVAQNPLKRKR